MSDGQEDAGFALEGRVALLPAAPDDLPGERVDGLLLVAGQRVPLALRDDSGCTPDLPELEVPRKLWRELSAGSIPARRIRRLTVTPQPHGYAGQACQRCRQCSCGAYLGAYLESRQGRQR